MTYDPGHYILVDREPVKEPDLITWARWMATEERRVALTEHELFRVSTVFLGLDHQFGRGPPILFETMVFYPTGDHIEGSPDRFDESGEQWRYATWDDAEAGHKATVKRMLEQVRQAGALARSPSQVPPRRS